MSVCACSVSYQRRWLLRVLFFLAVLQPLSADCPKSCVCHVSAEVHCTFRYLTAMPDHFPPAVERINLGYNSISILRENDLLSLESLELLMLHSNTIHSIEDRAFQDLKSLQILKMSNNKIKEINKETFKGLNSLLRLHVDHNHIKFINPEAFYGLTSLQLINLEGNHLQQLHPDTFITLRHNQVFKVSSVRTIHLSDNFLTTLPEDIFSGCSQLENVFLHGNPWMCDCRMKWFSMWAQRKTGVLKCKQDRRYPRGQLCPVCENPASNHNSSLFLLHSDAFTCVKPWIEPNLKQKNISLEEGDFTPVSPKDFIAPLGSIQMNLTDEFHSDASLSCTVRRPTAFENLSQTLEEEEGNNVTAIITSITTYLVCNSDYEHIQQLWQILATYSNSPMKLERGVLLARVPEMVYRYSQIKDGEEAIITNIEAEIKASPAWLMQREVSLQLDRTTTTYSTLHIKYQSVVDLRVESTPSKRDRYSWTMIKRDNQTKTEHTVITGGVALLNCQIQGDPKPLMEWILPDGSKVRAPYSSEDRRIIITAEGTLTLRGADSSDTGLYWCIATNYLDADILTFRVTVLSPDVEEAEVNGLQLSKSLGENVVLNCISSGSPMASVSWVLPDHTILDKSQGNKKVYKNGTLFIQGLTERDRGFYRCLVANHMGVDMLVSQVTLREEKRDDVATFHNEGSGMVTENSFSAGDEVSLREIPSPSLTEGTSQESRTITSDRPYPKPRLQDRGSSGGRLGQIRRGVARNRHIWSSRVYNKASRKIDPQKFAEFMKKAHHSSRLKDETRIKEVTQENPHTVFTGDGEIGSGVGHYEDHFTVVPRIVYPPTETITTTQKAESHFLTMGLKQIADIEGPFYHDDYLSQINKNISTPSMDSYMLSDSTPVNSMFMHLPSSAETTDFYALEKTSNAPLNIQPVTEQFTMMNNEQETQLKFSGESPAAAEIFTGPALSFTTDPNAIPLRDRPVEMVIHTDPGSQTTFTAITTTEKQQDKITFHTTQTIKSPRLSAGSTIISQQQIHIIPGKDGRGKGGRRIFHGRRRIVKPNRIPDIQSFINRLKKPTMRKEGNTSVPYRIELTTDCDEDNKKTGLANVHRINPTASSNAFPSKSEEPATTQKTTAFTTNHHTTSVDLLSHTDARSDVSTDYITSSDALKNGPTGSPFLNTYKLPSMTSTTATTTASKVIRGRIPWSRLFGGREREKLLGRLKRPHTPPKHMTTVQIVTVTPATTTAVMPTTPSLSLPESEPPASHSSIHIQSKESSFDDDYGGLSSADFEFTTAGPNFQPQTTTSPSHLSGFSTTAEIPAELQTLPSPPTVKPDSEENSDKLSSGSGGLPDNLLVVRHRPSGTRRRQGRRKKLFGGRRPLRKPGITKATHTFTTVSTTKVTTMETPVEPSTQSQMFISLYNPLHTQSKKEDRITLEASIDQTSTEIDLYDEFEWESISLLNYTTAKTPIFTSTTYKPFSPLLPTTTMQPETTRTGSLRNINPPIQKKDKDTEIRPPAKRIRPTVQSKSAKGNADEDLTFDTITIFTTEKRYNTPTPLNKKIHISTINNHDTGNQAPTSRTPRLVLTTKTTTKRPRIVGGNAASFTVLSNSDAFLPCEAVGNPEPVITWKRLSSGTESTMTITGRMGKFEVLRNGTLSVQNANVKDRGQYLCLAENDHGSDKLLVTLSVVAYPSRILEPKLREIKSHTGDTAEMKCKAEGRPMPMISWILANRTQVRGQSTENGRVSVSSEGTLVIKHVSVYDRGYYKCIASNPAGADTVTVRLQVVAAPPGIVEEKRQQLKSRVMQSLWLPCTGHGTPQPTIHWVLQDGSKIQSNRHARNKRISMYENGTLLIKDVALADSGKYECIATSSTGSERRVVTLTVETQASAPQIMETSDAVTHLSFGDQLRLNCLATGDPQPRIIWKLPSKAVVDYWHRMGRRIQVLANGTLIVNTVSEKDAGDYICVAQSTIGDDLQLMRVSISMKPAKIESKLYEKKKVPYGNDLKVDCKASGAPKPEISWGLPDGTMVNSALQSDASNIRGRARRYTLFENGTLYVNQVGISEEGDYTCYAENQVGKDEMHVHITVVTAAPRIHPPSRTHARVKSGGNIRFDCEAFGEPQPKILWKLPTNDVIAASNERYLVHVNGSLDIRDVTPIDAGEYVCMARNPGGENRKVYKLDIDGKPPVINGYRQNRTVIKDIAPKHSRKLINCKAEGDPTPAITWIMPDNIFLKAPYFGSRINVHYNGTLEIRNVRSTDTAEFICLARNDGGEAALVVQLEVTSMLRRPIFKNPFNERIVSGIGKTIVLNCSADGHPIPGIIWTLPNGTLLNHGSSQGSRHEQHDDGTLVINNSQKEDSGKYRCGAKNFLGYIEKLIILNIGQKPYILTRPKGMIRSVFGEPLFLHCLSDGSPRPTIYWTIPGGHTLTRPQVLGRYQLLRNGTLIVRDTTLHDRGSYICRAHNDAGEAMLTVPVSIIAYSPRITAGPLSNVRAVTGTPIRLNCAATGIPKPEISWELPDHSLLSAAKQGRPLGSELLHPQGTLIIQKPTVSDSGLYKCLAKNHLGTDSKVTYVLVV